MFYRRHLPHWHSRGKALFITWKLYRTIAQEYFLSRPEIAGMVADAIRYSECVLRHYDLHAWVVMNTHVHILVSPLVEPAAFLNTLKSFTAKRANEILHRAGAPFWQREYFDHCMRSQVELNETIAYIEANPVRAGGVERPEDFRWSSAYGRAR